MNRVKLVSFITTIIVYCFIVSGCTEPAPSLKDGTTSKLSITKTVELTHFSELYDQPFNFGNHTPTMLAVSDDFLYCSDGDRNRLFSWNIEKGNQGDAWVRLNNFTGAAPGSYDLNSGDRTIVRLEGHNRGVMVALTNALAAGATKRGGVAYFAAQLPQAQWSMTWSVAHAQENWQDTLYDMQMVRNQAGDAFLHALVSFTPVGMHARRMLLWGDVNAPQKGFLGVDAPSTLAHQDGSYVSSAINMGSMAQLPDGRLAIAEAQGLMTVRADTLATSSPKLEQNAGQVLDANHVQQWHEGLALGTQIDAVVAMRLVGERYLVVAARDTAKNYTLTFADLGQTPLVFDSSLKGHVGELYSIVVKGNEARIVGKEVVYGFKDGRFFVELSQDKLASDRAYIEKMSATDEFPDPPSFNLYTFKGGTIGDVPDDGTHFLAAAPYQDAWFYATDRGIFRVKKSLLTKSFAKD